MKPGMSLSAVDVVVVVVVAVAVVVTVSRTTRRELDSQSVVITNPAVRWHSVWRGGAA